MNNFVFNTNPSERYDGPNFEEYCIAERQYLPANRDRTPCISCPLNNLCIPGFEEQVRKIQKNENPSLTEGCHFSSHSLSKEELIKELTNEQINFLEKHIPNF